LLGKDEEELSKDVGIISVLKEYYEERQEMFVTLSDLEINGRLSPEANDVCLQIKKKLDDKVSSSYSMTVNFLVSCVSPTHPPTHTLFTIECSHLQPFPKVRTPLRISINH